MPLPKEITRYTYADYLEWDDDERVELINGGIFKMESPSAAHQEISMEISRQLANFLIGKPCKVYTAPLDVRLFEEEGDHSEHIDTVVQPDIMVICDKSKIDERGCKGAPDLIIEILSPSNFRHDMIVKLNLYNQAGVREYWIVDPEGMTVEVFLLDSEGKYQLSCICQKTDTAKVNVLDGCFIELSKVFPEAE